MGPCLDLLGPSPHLALRGPTRTTATGAPQPLLPPGKPYALLCLLALEPHGVTREELIRYLWPDAPPERARASVRQALHVVRRALAAAGNAAGAGGALAGEASTPLLEHDGRLTLAPGAVATDLDALQARLAAGDLEAAHALWHGGPFAHFSLADAPAFNDWADRIRSRWERRLGDALAARAEAERQAGRNADALPWLGRVLDVRPFDERAHALRVELLLELGMLDEADAALDRARSVVDEPSPGLLDELAGRLSAARRALAPGPADEAPVPYPVLAFAGRTREMAELRALWRTALSGRPRSVAILGPAGIGKTRLAEEWVRHTVGPDAAVVRVKALDTERALPLGLAAELAKSLASRPGAAGIANASLAVLRQLVPTLGNGSGPTPSGPLSDVAVAEALLDLVEAVASEAPVVLWVDDFQWTDPQSRAVLTRLARSLRAAQVLTLVTCRSGDADLSAVRLLRAEAVAKRFSTLELAPLTPDEVFEALSLSLEMRPQEEGPRAAARLASASQGNPLFLAELLLRLHAEGRIVEEAGRWVLHAAGVDPDLPLPASVREILEARLTAIPPELHGILGALAHAAGPLGPEELARRVRAPIPAVRGALDALAGQGIVTAGAGAAGLAGPSAPADEPPAGILFAHDSLRSIARDLFPAPQPGGVFRQALRGMPRWALAAGALVAAAGLAGIGLLAPSALRGPAPPPLHPGVLVVSEAGVVHRFRLPAERGGLWDTLPPIRIPRTLDQVAIMPRGDGDLEILGEVYSDMGVPSVVRLGPDGSVQRLLDHPSDVNLREISPNGRYALLSVADESSGRYRLDLVRYDLETGESVTLYRPLDKVHGRWFPDGAGILALIQSAPDTLLLLRPDGVELARRADLPSGAPSSSLPSPCGPSGATATALRWTDDGLDLVRWEWSADSAETVWHATVPVLLGMHCSPYGGAAAGVIRLEGVNRLLVVELATGDTLLGPAVPAFQKVAWMPDGPPPVPSRVRIAGSTLLLGWGESRAVETSVELADGTRAANPEVAWRSFDPAIASVRNGIVYANGVGTTSVVASVQGWIRDTLQVRVTGASLTSEALLADPLAAFDTTVWATYGYPLPAPAPAGDGPALELKGDGVGSDGIMSRRAFDLSRGGVLEASFRFQVTRPDRQRMSVCLTSGPPLTDPAMLSANWSREAVCFATPIGEFASFSASGFQFNSVGITPAPHASRLLPATAWRRVAVVLAPDGNARLLLNQQEVARLPWPVHNGPGVRWYVHFDGAAADTQLLIRDVVLWEGMRY